MLLTLTLSNINQKEYFQLCFVCATSYSVELSLYPLTIAVMNASVIFRTYTEAEVFKGKVPRIEMHCLFLLCIFSLAFIMLPGY